MGAGDFPAGEGPAGADPIAAPGPPRPTSPPRAALFDGATRTFILQDADGNLVDVHPVDHEVAIAVLLELQKVASSPTSGSTLRRVQIDEPARMQADVERRLLTAVKRPLDAGDITVVDIIVTSRVRWRISVVFRYLNNRIPGSPARTLST